MNEEEKEKIKNFFPELKIESYAIVKVYNSTPPEITWNYTGYLGAALVCFDTKIKSFFIKIIDLNANNVLYQQEFYEQFIYNSINSWFHVFETDYEIVGLSFADQQESQKFFNAVISSKLKLSQGIESVQRSLNKTPPLNSTNKTENYKINNKGKKELKKERKERKQREKREQKLQKQQMKEDSKRRPMDIQGPTNVQHISHIGWDPVNGFQIRNIPPEWKELFKQAGVRKSDLQNPETAAFIYNTVQNAIMSGSAPPPPPPILQENSRAPPPPPPILQENSRAPPPPPPISGKNLSSSTVRAPSLSPNNLNMNNGIYSQSRNSSLPPFNNNTIKAPPPPSLNYETNNYEENPPPPPPPPSLNSSSGRGGNNFLTAIQNTKLKSVDLQQQQQQQEEKTESSSGGNTLLETLSKAMAQRRLDLKEQDNEEEDDDDDDWSDEDW